MRRARFGLAERGVIPGAVKWGRAMGQVGGMHWKGGNTSRVSTEKAIRARLWLTEKGRGPRRCEIEELGQVSEKQLKVYNTSRLHRRDPRGIPLLLASRATL